MNNELKKNAEGYTDPTAAATLSQKEPGDVWTYDKGLCLILKNHGSFSTILLLSDTSSDPQNVRIETKDGAKYTDPRRVTYGVHRKMFSFEESISTGDFNRVMLAIENALDLKLRTSIVGNTEKYPRIIDGTEARVQEMQQELDKTQKERDFLLVRATELEALHAKAVERVNQVSFAKLKVENQLELLQSMVGSVLACFRADTEEG